MAEITVTPIEKNNVSSITQISGTYLRKGYSPYIQNGYWYIYDEATGEFVSSGVSAEVDYSQVEALTESLTTLDTKVDTNVSELTDTLSTKVDKETGKSIVNDTYIAKLENIDTLDKTVLEKFEDIDTDAEVKYLDLNNQIINTKSDLETYVDNKMIEAGSGDMQKSIYDTNNSGVVDNAEKVNGLTVETAVPNGAVFTDTTYSEATVSSAGLMSSTDKTKLNGIDTEANKTTVNNTLTSTSTTYALSANQGRVLNNSITSLSSTVDTNASNISTLQSDLSSAIDDISTNSTNITNVSGALSQAQSQITVLTNTVEDLAISRTQLFSGGVKSGSLTLSESAYNYRILVFFINSTTSGTPFGTGILPVLESPPSALNIIFGDTTATSKHSTYMGKVTIDSTGLIVTISQAITNVTHYTGASHTGGTTYYIREVWGIK